MNSTKELAGQHDLREACYFLLLKDKGKISLNIYENNNVIEKDTFAILEKSIFTTDQKERVAVLDTDKNIISLYRIHTSEKIELSIPYNIKPKTILINDDNLFLGGEITEEQREEWLMYDRVSDDKKACKVILVQYHIQSEKWYQLETPLPEFDRKAIEDILVNDNLLIAIDNIVMPKYILFYKLNKTEKLAYSHFKQLNSNGTYEHIYQGRITSDYLGLRSRTVGRAGNAHHITFYKGLDLTESFAISAFNDFRKSKTHEYNDFLIIGNKAAIASKENGLGYFEIKDSYFNNNYVFPQACGGAFTSFSNSEFNSQVRASKISYKKYKNENIIRLTQIPNTSKIVLSIKNKSKNIRHEIIEI